VKKYRVTVASEAVDTDSEALDYLEIEEVV